MRGIVADFCALAMRLACGSSGGGLLECERHAIMKRMATETIQYGRVTWTNIERVTPQDMQDLRDTYPHFHPLDIEDLQSRIERPKMDEYDDYMFVVMHFPLWDPVQRVSRAAEVDMFVGSGYLITSHDGTLKALRHLFEQCQVNEELRAQYMGRGASRLF